MVGSALSDYTKYRLLVSTHDHHVLHVRGSHDTSQENSAQPSEGWHVHVLILSCASRFFLCKMK